MIVLSGKVKVINRLRFSPDGVTLAACGGEGLQVWEAIAEGTRPRAFPTLNGAEELAFVPQSRRLYTSKYPELFRVDLETGRCDRLDWGRRVMSFAVQPDGRRVLLVEYSDGKFVLTCRETDDAHALVWERPDTCWGARRQFLISGRELLVVGNGAAEVRFALHDVDTGEEVHRSERMVEVPNETVISPDEAIIACRTRSRIHVYPLRSAFLYPIATLANESNRYFTGIAFHPSGRYLAATSNDATVKLYDTATWEVARTFTWDIGRMRSIAFSPDGTLAAAGSDSGKVVIWDVDF